MQKTNQPIEQGYIFISYSRKQQEYARSLADLLRKNGFDVWIDDRIDYGEDWWKAIVHAIKECRAVIVVMTPDAYASRWCQREVQLADSYNKPMFPLLWAGDNWEIFVLTQFLDVRQHQLPGADFITRLNQVVPRNTTSPGQHVTPQTPSAVTLRSSVNSRVSKISIGLVLGITAIIGIIVTSQFLNRQTSTATVTTTSQQVAINISATASPTTSLAAPLAASPTLEGTPITAVNTSLPTSTLGSGLTSLPKNSVVTPYDGKVALWLWRGSDTGALTIDELAQTIKNEAPTVNALFVKVSDGADWMAKYDTSAALAIDGTAAITRWTTTLQKYGIEFHAWAVPIGRDIEAESALLIQVCNTSGVKSLILDVEPYQGFWAGGEAGIAPFMQKLRDGAPKSFHIGLMVDSRQAHYSQIFPDVWKPFIDSVHPQVYWPDFQNTPQAALQDAYTTWANYGRPIIPVLSGFNTDPTLMDQARMLALFQYNAPGLSWWALGQIDAAHFQSINYPIPPSQKTISVPYRSQEDPDARRFRSDSGSTAVAMLIDWIQQNQGLTPQLVSIDTLSAETALAQSDTGLTSDELIQLAVAHGIKLVLQNNVTVASLKNEIANGNPAVVLINNGALPGRENQADTSEHFVIVTGYDTNNIYVNDPDWWNQGSITRNLGHNWKIPTSQFQLALQQAPQSGDGAFYVSS